MGRYDTYDNFAEYITDRYLPSIETIIRAGKFLLGASVLFAPLFAGIIIGGLLGGTSGVLYGMGVGFIGSVVLMLYADYRQYHSDGETVWYERLINEGMFGK